jgi:hypothetical protein
MENTAKQRDKWDKWDILLKPVGGLMTALAVTFIGIYGSNKLDEKQSRDSNERLYAQIMSVREKADSDLRKDMFNAIIKAFMSGGKSQGDKPQGDSDNSPEVGSLSEIEKNILALELLAYNFHNAIDLGPLFKHIEKQISLQSSDRQKDLHDRLVKVAREVTSKQIETLKDVGVVKTADVFFEGVEKNPAGLRLHEADADADSLHFVKVITPDLPDREIFVDVLSIDKNKKEMKVRLEVYLPDKEETEADFIFDVDFFDFPMIDNTRLKNGQRVALGISKWEQISAEIWLAYFPGSRASLKDKPYYDEVMQPLRRSRSVLKEDGAEENEG